MLDRIDHSVKTGLDVIAVATAAGGVMEIVPPIAAILSVVWLSLQIYAWFVNKRWKRRNG